MASDRVKDVRLKLNAGTTPDGFSEVVQVEDTNNVVFLPDGSAMQPREGSEIRRRDEIGFGSDRKVIYFIADPPDVDYGDMICLVNTKDGRNDVQITEIVRTTVTKSAENPLSMPGLPDWTPPPSLNPLLYKFEMSGEFLEAKAMFYDADSDSVVGPASFGPTYPFTDDAQVFRTDNYIVIVDGHNTTGYLTLNAYDLRTINPVAGNLTTYSVQVFADAGLTTSNKHVYAYAGDVVYIIDDIGSGAYGGVGENDYRLFKVDLSDGATVTDAAITGLPTMTGFVTGVSYGANAVDNNGDLLAYGYDLGGSRYVLRINPATAVCTGYYATSSVVAANQEDSSFAVASGGVLVAPDHSLAVRVYDSALTTETVVSTGDMGYYNTVISNANSLLGNLWITINGSDFFIYDLTTCVKSANVSPAIESDYAWLPASVFDSGTFAMVTYDNSDNGTLHFINAATGAVNGTRTFVGISSVVQFTDAFAYGLQNTQGNRLT